MPNLFISNSSMKKFLMKILFFALVLLSLATILDMAISSSLRNNENRMYAGWNAIYNDTTNYDLVVLGNSRAVVQYDPSILDSVLDINSINLGIDGSAINRQMIKYNKYIDIHKYPKYVIQNIDFATMDTTYGYEREQFFPYFFYDRDLINDVNKYEKFSFAERWIPCYRYLGYKDVLLEAFFYDNTQHYFEFLEKGYKGHELPWDGTALEALDTVVCSCNPYAFKEYTSFLTSVMQNGTEVIFVYAPMYYKVVEKMTNKDEMYYMYQELASQFKIPILDYTDMSICYDTTYFYNGTHLNKIGAEIFTTQLAHDLDSLLVE